MTAVLHESPGDLHGYCGGKDEVDGSCTCPDPIYTAQIRLKTAENLKPKFRIWCYCCGLPIVHSNRSPA